MQPYRFTIPSSYVPGTPGHTDPTARQGYYVQSSSASMGQLKLASELRDKGYQVSGRKIRASDLELDRDYQD